METRHFFSCSTRIHLGCLALMLFGGSVLAGDLYRYRDDNGHLVINHTVPPHFAKNGYERMDLSGRVVERVEPAREKTETSKEVLVSPQVRKDRERRDKYLLASFSTVEEISAAGDRKLGQLLREIDILKTNSGDIVQLRSSVESEAAQFQRGGKDIPEEVMSRLSDANQQVEKNAESLATREAEHEEIRVLYAYYADRFRALKGLPLVAASEAGEASPATPLATDPSSSRLVSE